MTFLLGTDRLIIRNWRDDDATLFFEINSDPRVMEFFPFVRNREQSDEVMRHLRDLIAGNGYGFTALELRDTGECIGFCGLSPTRIDGLPDGMTEIGWRLAVRHWGKGYVTEAAKALLSYGFIELGLDEIVSFAVHDNHRSTSVMQRIGMTRDAARDFDHPIVPDTMPHLKRHVFYTLQRLDWQNRK
ncbi:MAG: GNAT family N-acetyltransferase [Nitratireductor sp.]